MIRNYLLISLLVILSSSIEVDAQESMDSFRQTHLKELLEHERSPIVQEDLKYISFYEDDTIYRVTADVEIFDEPSTFMMPTYSGNQKEFRKYARARFDINDGSYDIYIYQNVKVSQMPEYANHLFLPFKDLTNGEETYGGGRYIDLDVSDISEGIMIIDFNKCYNPWCAYSDGYNCPIPPLENHLPLEIHAGEKGFAGMKHKK